jgi:exodeoxyribonuclease VII large subunit
MLSGMRHQMEAQTGALTGAIRNLLLEKKVVLERRMTALEALSPVAILERGYALIFDSSGKLLKDASAVKVGDEISARVAHGEISAQVLRKK